MIQQFMSIATSAIAAAIILPAAWQSAQASEGHYLERWRSYAGVSWEAPRAGQNPAPFRNSVNAPIAGLHFDGAGRAFVSTPRVVAPDAPATLSILDTAASSGPARLTAFPSAEANSIAGDPATRLRNVLGFHVDRRNGWLWALDQGWVAGEAEAPPGAQKIMVFELRSGALVKTIGLDAAANRQTSFLNDIAVDERRRIAYVSDSGLRGAPSNSAAIIIADFASGKLRRVLDRHPAVMPEPGVKVMSHGEEVWPGKPLVLGVNGIALSPDARTLYWAVTTGHAVHALPTALLRDPGATPAALEAALRSLGRVGNTDGIVTDAVGKLYITDVSRNGIAAYDPRSGKLSLLAADEGVHWPDTAAFTPDGVLVFTASQLNRHFAGQVKPGQERYELWRLRQRPGRQAKR